MTQEESEKTKDEFVTARKLNRQSRYLSVAALILNIIALLIRIAMAQQWHLYLR